MTQYVQLSADTTKVVTWFAGPQAITSDKPGYAEIGDTDARYLAWQAAIAARASYAAALVAGVQLTSIGTSALSATYACDAGTQAQITSEAVYIQATTAQGAAKFTNGQTTKGWPDATGVLRTFNTTQFINFAESVAQYIDALATALQMVAGGGAWSAPSSAISIP
jgi:hypothetical protein